MAHSDVCPENLRFTRDYIKKTFRKPYEYQRIDDAVDQIGNNELSPAVFTPLNVVQHKSVLWCLDNRRLWVLRKAGVPTVKVIFVLPNYNRSSEKFFASLNDPLVRQYSRANYFPSVRGVRSVGINSCKGASDGVPRAPIRMHHYPTAVAGANKTTPLLPQHLKTCTVRIDIPAKVNHESNSNCFHKQSQPMAQCDACPNKLRFTQDSIKNTFKEPYEHQRIDDAVDQIGNNQLSPADLMPLRVVKHKSVLWSLDNRRLWVLRKAGVPTVKVIWVLPNHNRRSVDFFSSLSDPLLEREYSSANYFPRVRGGFRLVGINGSNVSSSGGAHPPPIPLLLQHPSNRTLPKSTSTAPPHLRDLTVRIDIPPPPVPLLHHHSTTVAGAAQANRTWEYKRTPPPPTHHMRDYTVRINIHPSIPPLRNTSQQLSEVNVPLLSNDSVGSDLLTKILNFVRWVKEKVFGFFRPITPAGNQGNYNNFV
ncbi:hypothetical protein SUGI_0101970 [Cryptomeria japonica]|nr:hypothetical protein SUGI_0101970 [Cryptomeria japonica]